MLIGAEILLHSYDMVMSEFSLLSYLSKRMVCAYSAHEDDAPISVYLVDQCKIPFNNEAEFRVLLLHMLGDLDERESNQEIFFAVNGIDAIAHDSALLSIQGEIEQESVSSNSVLGSHLKLSRLLIIYHRSEISDEFRAHIVIERDFGNCTRSYLAWYRSDTKELSSFQKMHKEDTCRFRETYDRCWERFLPTKD